jgi:cysteine-rich repeat protein
MTLNALKETITELSGKLSGTVVCASCDISKGLALVGNDCQCKPGYFFNSSINSCQETCGDGFAIKSECDDGNTISNDGCSSTCFLQSDFVFDYLTSPPSLKTEILLKYKVTKIIRHENENSAMIFLRPSNFQSLPFSVQKGQFEPISSQISFIVVISQSPYKEGSGVGIFNCDKFAQLR